MPNFGLLQAIQPPSVVAQLPQSNSNGLDSFAGGLMGGLQQGTNIAAQRQQMQQNAELFPLLKQQNQQAAESGAIDLADKKQGQEDKKTLREAAKQGEASYLKALSQISPEAVQDFQLKKAQVAETTAKSTLYGEQATGQGLDNYSTSINIQAQINSSALSSKDPAMQQKIYEYGRANAPKAVQELMPKQFDQNTAMATVILAKENIADYQDKEGKKPTETVNTLNQLQEKRTRLESEISKAKAEGRNVMSKERELKEVNALIDTKVKNKQEILNTTSEATSAKIKVDAEGLKAAKSAKDEAKVLDDILNQAEATINKISDFSQGPIAGNFSSFINSDVQVLDQLSSMAVSKMRQIMKFPAAGFSDADANRLEKSVFTKTKDKKANIMAIKILRDMRNQVVKAADEYESDYKKEYGIKEDGEKQSTASNPIEEEMRRRGLIK
jgi:hypothetical protein